MFDLTANMNDVRLATKTVNFNTDSIFDLQVGGVERGVDGKFYVTGGYGPSLVGGIAKPGYYKSTFMGSMAARIAALYGVQEFIVDSEDAISRSRERLVSFAGEHWDLIDPDLQIKCLDGTTEYDVDHLLKFVQEICAIKKQNAKNLMITTPFHDADLSGKELRMMAPTILFIDSLTELHCLDEMKIVDDGLDSSKAQTIAMRDALKKTYLLRWLKKLAVEYNIIVVMTAHFGKKIDIDGGYGPTPKTLQYMQADMAIKGVGSKFMFLTSPQVNIDSCKVLQDDSKQCWYKNGDTGSMDVNELIIKIQRCKNNSAGTMQPYIVSQSEGYLEDATNFHYTKTIGKMFGLTGNMTTCAHALVPDKSMTRNSMRRVIGEDYRIHRAFQLTAQLLYLQRNWNINELFPHNIDPQKFCDFIMSSKDPYTKDLILESRGYWLPKETKNERPYMSIMDLLEFIKNNSQQLIK